MSSINVDLVGDKIESYLLYAKKLTSFCFSILKNYLKLAVLCPRGEFRAQFGKLFQFQYIKIQTYYTNLNHTLVPGMSQNYIRRVLVKVDRRDLEIANKLLHRFERHVPFH